MSEHASICIGIDLGGTNIAAGAVTAGGRIVARNKIKTKAELGEKVVLERVAKAARSLLDDEAVKSEKVVGMGVGAPGPVDIHTGVLATAVNLGWGRVPLADRLSAALKLPVIADNDVNVGTWGEFKAGAGKGQRDMMGIFVGTGIGAALVLDGRLFHGAAMSAGEIGHTVIASDAGVGRRTLENLASRTAIVNRLTALIQSNRPSLLTELTEGNLAKIRSRILAQAWEKKDPLTVEVLSEAAHHIGIAIANAVTLLSLPCVVIGGGLAEALDDRWHDLVQASFDDVVFPPERRTCKIRPSRLGDDAGIIGAALLAHQHLAVEKAAPAGLAQAAS